MTGSPVPAQAVLTEQQQHIPAVLLGEQGVHVGVGARVQWVEEDEQDLGVGDVDERVSGNGRQAEEGDRRPAGKVGEDEQRHSFGDRLVRVARVTGRRGFVAADRVVHVAVADADH